MRRALTRNVPRERNLEEIEQYHNQLSKYASTPDVQALKDVEICAIDDGATVSLLLKLGTKLYKVDLTEV